MNPAERLIVALDLPEPRQARAMADTLGDTGVAFKIGLELFLAGGPDFVAEMASRYRVFLDLKFHDIPSTVAAAVKAAALLGVWMVNIHAAGGREMMAAAREALADFNQKPLLLAVTVLTSLDRRQLSEVGVRADLEMQVRLLASLAAESGMDGVVCSPLEIKAVKDVGGSSFLAVSPGVRPAGSLEDDQSRVATPREVIRAGGDYLVVGRPIRAAYDPAAAAFDIIKEMRESELK
ncbi:MAG TPA: orotidine-5'-phosphate decarboxylase [Firmicutes bacterium]|nr:orotidine-5'-phosphate decarboxylase [Bacillota bacterium]